MLYILFIFVLVSKQKRIFFSEISIIDTMYAMFTYTHCEGCMLVCAFKLKVNFPICKLSETFSKAIWCHVFFSFFVRFSVAPAYS